MNQDSATGFVYFNKSTTRDLDDSFGRNDSPARHRFSPGNVSSPKPSSNRSYGNEKPFYPNSKPKIEDSVNSTPNSYLSRSFDGYESVNSTLDCNESFCSPNPTRDQLYDASDKHSKDISKFYDDSFMEDPWAHLEAEKSSRTNDDCELQT